MASAASALPITPAVAKNSEYRPSGSRLSIIEGSEPTDRPRRKRSSHMAGDTRFWINPETGWRLSASPASIPVIIMVITVNMCVCLLPPGLLRFYLKVMRAREESRVTVSFCAGGTVFVSGMFFASLPFFVFLYCLL